MRGIPGTANSATTNPYAPTAVATLTEEGQAPVTVPTAAVRRATAYLDTYLDTYTGLAPDSAAAEPPAPDGAAALPSPGNVVAIVGDYGTGKTHLANHLMVHLRERTPDDSHAIYLEASRTGSFLSLYQEFMRVLQEHHDLIARVREYYTDVVADWLRTSTLFPPEIVEGLRAGETTTRHIAQTFGLTEASHLQELQRRLRHVTRNEQIGKVLALLAREGFEDDVRRWLLGDPPAASLQERGITDRIDSDAAALEAMGVFALLYGHRNHRFLLVIDEIEKLLLHESPEGLASFKKLLEVFAAARGFLVIVGLPDVVQVIGAAALERIGNVVSMPALDTKDVEQLVLDSHERTLGRRTLQPFTEDGLRYLTQLAGGAPRPVIRLLHRCFADAAASGRAVTPDLIREAVPGSAFFTRDHVIAAVRHVATSEGLRPEVSRRLSREDPTLVDVWVPSVHDPEVGVAFTVTDSVLTPGDADRVTAAARAIRRTRPDAVTRLLVAGWVSPDLDDQLADAFGASPVVYQPDASFDQAVVSVIRPLTVRTEPGPGQDDVTVMDQLEALRWQQDSTRTLVEQLVSAVDRLRSSSEHRGDSLQERLTDLRDDLAAAEILPSTTSLTPEVQAHFDEAQGALREIFRLRQVLAAAFEVTSHGSALLTPAASTLVEQSRAILGGASTAETIGVLASVEALVDSFRDAVVSWSERFGDAAAPPPRADALDALRSICSTYDDLFEPLERRLSGWERLLEWWEAPTGRVLRGATGDRPALQRGQQLRALLTELGVAVRRAASQAG